MRTQEENEVLDKLEKAATIRPKSIYLNGKDYSMYTHMIDRLDTVDRTRGCYSYKGIPVVKE